MKNTNAPETPEARLVVSSKQLHVSSASGVFSAVEEGVLVTCNRDYNSPPDDFQENSTAAEALTAPVASVGVDAFELVGLMFVTQGDMSETRVRRAVDNVRKAVVRG